MFIHLGNLLPLVKDHTLVDSQYVCSSQSTLYPTSNAVPAAFAIISPGYAPHSLKNRSKTSVAFKNTRPVVTPYSN